MTMKSGFFSSDEKAEPVLSSEHIRALSILTYSDNAELQRSAALCTLEISERCKCVYISSHMFVTWEKLCFLPVYEKYSCFLEAEKCISYLLHLAV